MVVIREMICTIIFSICTIIFPNEQIILVHHLPNAWHAQKNTKEGS